MQCLAADLTFIFTPTMSSLQAQRDKYLYSTMHVDGNFADVAQH